MKTSIKCLFLIFLICIILVPSIYADRLELVPREKGFFNIIYKMDHIYGNETLFHLLAPLEIIESFPQGCSDEGCYFMAHFKGYITTGSTQLICSSEGQKSSQPIFNLFEKVTGGIVWSEQVFRIPEEFRCNGETSLEINNVKLEGKGFSFMYPFDTYDWKLLIRKVREEDLAFVVKYDKDLPKHKAMQTALFNLSESQMIIKKVFNAKEPFEREDYKEFELGIMNDEYPEFAIINISSYRRGIFSYDILIFSSLLVYFIFITIYSKKVRNKKGKYLRKALFSFFPIFTYIIETSVIKNSLSNINLMSILIGIILIKIWIFDLKKDG